jgi:hypothetical protein
MKLRRLGLDARDQIRWLPHARADRLGGRSRRGGAAQPSAQYLCRAQVFEAGGDAKRRNPRLAVLSSAVKLPPLQPMRVFLAGKPLAGPWKSRAGFGLALAIAGAVENVAAGRPAIKCKSSEPYRERALEPCHVLVVVRSRIQMRWPPPYRHRFRLCSWPSRWAASASINLAMWTSGRASKRAVPRAAARPDGRH